ncbi:thiamine pyrophosphate-dependent enzyme [Gandjariella thermophila]|uniref:Benzoylformate decarboxylase n=1 Tax=Gandjariella thermophila TaxID=1931992 RepID=A0A4D4JEV7_9PSEU|nr:thiamine pyrophosphate-dependent enzyme [Gandjariella thermophila]GDY32849.1 benzoylformate decarboxylase [Gandjariella thermophila]
MRTVRDEAFEVVSRLDMGTIFANPGSTEVPMLTDLPDDLEFVLALHEASVVGMATGWALGRRSPAFVVLHTTAGLGNAVGALATARVNRAPLVVLVGQQDRRHLALEPFLTGRLTGLAGDYPVSVEQPLRAQDVPGALARAWHTARERRGPALVIVPMDDWSAPAEDSGVLPAATEVHRATGVDEAVVGRLVEVLAEATSPALVVGAGADDRATWRALVALAERLRCPVRQESFGARAGFPQDHPLFAGHLPAARSRLRQVLAGHDVVLCVGAPVFRQYPYEPGPLAEPGTRVLLVTDDPEEAHRSPVELAVLGGPGEVCARLAERVPARDVPMPATHRAAPPPPPGPSEPLRAAHVLAALAERLPADAVVVEETPSTRPDLHALLPARAPMGFLSAAMGGLGFALPAATGLRMARPDRPVVAVVGDGASLYAIQSLWTAAHYGVGALFVVLSNGRYAVLDHLARGHGGGKPPWPGFAEISVRDLALALGCPASRPTGHAELLGILDDVVPGLADRGEPLLLDVPVTVDPTFDP